MDVDGLNQEQPVEVVRDILKRYAFVRTIYPEYQNDGVYLWWHLHVILKGQYSGKYMARALWAIYALSRPMQVTCGVTKRSWKKAKGVRGYGVAPYVCIAWTGKGAIPMLDAIGWKTGKESLDKKLQGYKRWVAYREAAGASWRHGIHILSENSLEPSKT